MEQISDGLLFVLFLRNTKIDFIIIIFKYGNFYSPLKPFGYIQTINRRRNYDSTQQSMRFYVKEARACTYVCIFISCPISTKLKLKLCTSVLVCESFF